MRVKTQNSCQQLGADGVSGVDMFNVLAVAISLLDKRTRDPSRRGIASAMAHDDRSRFLASDVKPSQQAIQASKHLAEKNLSITPRIGH
jgi:hypothetical protein